MYITDILVSRTERWMVNWEKHLFNIEYLLTKEESSLAIFYVTIYTTNVALCDRYNRISQLCEIFYYE